MGIAVELGVLLAIAILGPSTVAPFEVETPPWRSILKWALVVGATHGLYHFLGHWALVVPLGLGALGLTVHLTWCRRHSIHPLRATPRRKY